MAERASRCEGRPPRDPVVVEYRETIDSNGFDEAKQLAPEPWGALGRTGLRVPPATGTSIGGHSYRFLLCVADLNAEDMIIGTRQGVDIGQYLGSGDGGIFPPLYPMIRNVVTSDWRFTDAAYQFTLTKEPMAPRAPAIGPFDQESFVFRDGRCALVYAAAGFPGVPLLPGYLGLNAYTPPTMKGEIVRVWRDVRTMWSSEQCEEDWRVADRPTRFRLYCDVRQHDPIAFPPPTLSGSELGLVVEEQFLQAVPLAQYWAVYGRLVISRKRRI